MMKIGKTMSKMKKKSTGVLARIAATQNPEALARTRNRMLIAMKISLALEEKGMNQKSFAEMMGKTESEISEWLSGDRNFTIDTLTDISQKLGITLLNTSTFNMRNIPQEATSMKASTRRNLPFISTKVEWEICVSDPLIEPQYDLSVS